MKDRKDLDEERVIREVYFIQEEIVRLAIARRLVEEVLWLDLKGLKLHSKTEKLILFALHFLHLTVFIFLLGIHVNICLSLGL